MLISEAYRALNAKQHKERPDWGRQSLQYWETVIGLADWLEVKKLLDYGCGKQMLKSKLEPLGFDVTGYDPAFPHLSATPDPHGLVVCTDVLEHVEPECLDAVLADLRRVTLSLAFLVIATRASKKPMPDGTNPHRIVESREWWLERLGKHFVVASDYPAFEGRKYFSVVVRPR